MKNLMETSIQQKKMQIFIKPFFPIEISHVDFIENILLKVVEILEECPP